ncbi:MULTISPECIES: hypothetical protein [unclassified Pseudomonas]|uniref:hypothetical protein n=1 Tax=unclassified Pseudomonas TaxID=196821 RepID=UPI00117BAE28|nr:MULTISPECIES: hypothetical protein [unclassified Pseudomonas]
MSVLLSDFSCVSKYHNVVLKDGVNGEPKLKSGFFQGRCVTCLGADEVVQARNGGTKSLFLNALGKKYGAETALFLMPKLEMDSGKPLNGRLIRTVVADAEAMAMAKKVASFNKMAVSSFCEDSKGIAALFKHYVGSSWLERPNINQFQSVLTAQAENSKEQLQQHDIKKLAESTLSKIGKVEQGIVDSYKCLIEGFQSDSHGPILGALDRLAENIHARAELDIFSASNLQAGDGAEDQIKYQRRIMELLLKSVSVDGRRGLLELILNHPTSKELFQLLGGGGTSFVMSATGVMEDEGVPHADQVVLLNTLYRTEPTLYALLSVLDMYVSNSTEISPRLKEWFSARDADETTGQIEYAEPEFAKAFVDLQRDQNGVNMDNLGLSNFGSAEHCKKRLTIDVDEQMNSEWLAIANQRSEHVDVAFVKDFTRLTYYVDGEQVSKHLDDNGELDEAKNDIGKVPLFATRFAHQGIFVDVLRLLAAQHKIIVGVEPLHKFSSFSLQSLPDNSIQLRAHNTSRLKALIRNDAYQQLDPRKSSESYEVNILIQEKDGKVSARFNSPIRYEYRAVPLEE